MVRAVSWLLVAVASAPACECAPARSKPWRHASGPKVASGALAGSEVLAAESGRVRTLAARRHTLRIHMDRRPRHLNPMVTPSVWTMRIAADTIFETLIRYQPPPGGAGAGPGTYRPGLARSWHLAATGREIRIDLEPDVVFHNGGRMTSVDVQFSLDAVRSPRVAAEHLRAGLSDVEAVELISSRALRIRLKRPNGYVLRALADVPILPAQVYRGKLAATRGPVIGTGPYRLESRQEDTIRLVRFDRYWASGPAVERLEFVYQPDAARALTAAKRGEFDLIPGLIPEHYPEQASAPGVESSFVPVRLRPPHFRYLLVNASKAPLSDPRMRHALALLIDRATLARDVHGGLMRPVAGPVWPGGPGDGPAPALPPYDPGGAGELMDSAGWRDRDGDGARERDGERLLLSLVVLDDADRRDVREREQILRSFRRLGIRVTQRSGPRAVVRKRLRAGDFDLAFVEWRGGVDRDFAALFETRGVRNTGRFSSSRVDSALAALRAVWQPSARGPLMAELARALAETWPVIPLTAPDPYGLLHRRVRGAVVWNGWISLRALSLEPAAR
ncbi:MAG: ABC transporter substrate-binding protein [Proteobacteria bacterium]|nr:ABC transporter substrate-binding protein [Pseudomonadota bacterium]